MHDVDVVSARLRGRREETMSQFGDVSSKDTSWLELKPPAVNGSLDGGDWPEVKLINGLAALLGYLSMATRGLGFLAVTWTTVVLLGGFVSILSGKDFWCLTLVTFIQVAGVVDAFVSEKISLVGSAASGLNALTKVFARNRMADTTGSGSIELVKAFVKQVLGWIAALVHLLAYIIVTYGINFLYSYGLFIITGVSLWRLIQRDYGVVDGDASKANLKPALDVLYILVLIQGAISAYVIIIKRSTWKRMGDEVASEYGFKRSEYKLVRGYMEEIRKGCFKDPSFAQGKNLATYAVELMCPDKSPEDHMFGLFILSTLLGPFSFQPSDKLKERQMFIRLRIVYSSSSIHILRFLFLIITLISSDTEIEKTRQREITERAVRLVAHVATGVSLEQLPQVIQCVSLLLDTFGEYLDRALCADMVLDYREPTDGYMNMLLQGLCILFVLASDENKCRIISETPGLLPKIMVPLTFDFLHKTLFFGWKSVVEFSLRVLCRLTAALGDTGAKLRREISVNREAISTMTRILNCDECHKEHRSLSIEILTKLDMDNGSTEDFVKMLVGIFNDAGKDNSIRTTAVEALAMLCRQGRGNGMLISQLNIGVVYGLKKELEAPNRDKIYLKSAAEILQHLCIHYTNNDEFLEKLKEGMTSIMPKVLIQILTGDIQDQHAGASQENVRNKSSSTRLESEDVGGASQENGPESKVVNRETQAALLSLCVTICDTFIAGDQDLGLQFEAMGEFSLASKLEEMVVKNRGLAPSFLTIMKVTSRMVISMMKHRGTYSKQELESLLEALPNAGRRNMFLIDSTMGFAGGSVAATTLSERTLCSLMPEAWELVRNYNEEGNS